MVADNPVVNKATLGMTYEEKLQYYMRHPGYECLAGEPQEMTREIIQRLTVPSPLNPALDRAATVKSRDGNRRM